MFTVDCGMCDTSDSIVGSLVHVDTIGRDVPRFDPCEVCGARVSGWDGSTEPPEPTSFVSARQARQSEREYRRQRISAGL